jgi:hypothetical protein
MGQARQPSLSTMLRHLKWLIAPVLETQQLFPKNRARPRLERDRTRISEFLKMPIKNISPVEGGQAQLVDFLEVMRRNDKAPKLDELLKLAPDEPIGPCERIILVQKPGVGWVEGKAKQWPKSVSDLRAKFPGYQPGYWFRENMKYGDVPADDAPLSEWVAKMIDHAKAKWSGEIDGRKTRLQFKEWLPYYLDNDRLCWTGHPKLRRARELLRIACGMPRFAPTRGAANDRSR